MNTSETGFSRRFHDGETASDVGEFPRCRGSLACGASSNMVARDWSASQAPSLSGRARDPSAPPVLDSPSSVNRRAMEMENQKELRANIAKLYDMVVELKEQVEKTDANSTLSVPLMKKAQQIEKLAKQIKNLAKG